MSGTGEDRFTPAGAARLEELDPLSLRREDFAMPSRPQGPEGADPVYLCGHSLGPMPKRARELVNEELEAWATRGVGGHFGGARPWYDWHERLRGPLARLLGARESEVVAMNSLTTNIHLLMASFYRPTSARRTILIEDDAFTSDLYAVRSQVAFHGFDPDQDVVTLGPRLGESVLRPEDVVARIEALGEELALVLWPGVQYLTGQRFDLRPLADAAHRVGAHFGADLAHAVGNVPLSLNEDDVDFAVFCTYKYLNAGPGAVGGAFVHERHAKNTKLPRLAGWWGHDPKTRFDMDRERRFRAMPSADGWQLSNPSILAMAPLLASLEIFDEVGMDALRARSERLTGYLEESLARVIEDDVSIVTPREKERRGAQLSLRFRERIEAAQRALDKAGIVVDLRRPDVLRVAPAPLYNGFEDIQRFVALLDEHLREERRRPR